MVTKKKGEFTRKMFFLVKKLHTYQWKNSNKVDFFMFFGNRCIFKPKKDFFGKLWFIVMTSKAFSNHTNGSKGMSSYKIGRNNLRLTCLWLPNTDPLHPIGSEYNRIPTIQTFCGWDEAEEQYNYTSLNGNAWRIPSIIPTQNPWSSGWHA